MRLLRAQARRVVDEDLDVLVAEPLCSGGHVAVEVGAFLRLEFAQLREKILVLLSRQTRDVLLAAQRSRPRSCAREPPPSAWRNRRRARSSPCCSDSTPSASSAGLSGCPRETGTAGSRSIV